MCAHAQDIGNTIELFLFKDSIPSKQFNFKSADWRIIEVYGQKFKVPGLLVPSRINLADDNHEGLYKVESFETASNFPMKVQYEEYFESNNTDLEQRINSLLSAIKEQVKYPIAIKQTEKTVWNSGKQTTRLHEYSIQDDIFLAFVFIRNDEKTKIWSCVVCYSKSKNPELTRYINTDVLGFLTL